MGASEFRRVKIRVDAFFFFLRLLKCWSDPVGIKLVILLGFFFGEESARFPAVFRLIAAALCLFPLVFVFFWCVCVYPFVCFLV